MCFLGERRKVVSGLTVFAGASLLAMANAHAGGFAIREQSALYQGMSFAGAGVGDNLSSMYWNSAAAAAAPGFNTETHGSILDADTEMTATGGFFVRPNTAAPGNPPTGLGLGSESGDIADPAFIPASYANYQLSDRLFLGLATNSGFGTVTKPSNTDWAGSPLAITSDVFSINLNPTVAYKVTDGLTIGVGAQVEYLSIRLNNTSREADLDDIGFGATAGLTWTPTQGTTIGLGYRSAVNFDLEGDYDVFSTGVFGANADVTLPDMITIGLRQSLSENLDLLAGYEWTNWSRLGTIPVSVDVLGTPEALELEYENGHFVSLGLEYAYSPLTMLRTGIAWEASPIVDEERNVFLPDADRLWLSVGATHQLTDKITIDLAYTHIFVDDATICRGPAPTASACTNSADPANVLLAESESSVNIVSASFKYHWGGGEPDLEPLK
jgi:long-chain fatty acid transport protein